MEYKEVRRNSDKRIFVFCNFEELLTDFYGVKTMEEVMPHAVNNEFIIHCPFCKAEGHRKHKLYIKDDLTVGNCFVCGRAFVHVSDRVDTTYRPPNNYGFKFFQGDNIVKLDDPLWSIDKFKYEFTDYDERGYQYLISRHGFMKDLYKILDIKFWDGNPVIPFFYKGEVIYYQIRFTNPGKIKYFMPPISSKPPYIIERGEPYKHRIMIVEGIFDAIAALIQCPDYMPVAVLGSSISDYQIDFIRGYCDYISEIRIWMDETRISKGIANKLKGVIDYCPINIIKSDGPDPEEIMIQRLKKRLPVQWIKSDYVGVNNDENIFLNYDWNLGRSKRK
jgi:hypothetical protein